MLSGTSSKLSLQLHWRNITVVGRTNLDREIGWGQVSFLAFDSRFHHRRMKESILIDIFAQHGVMKIEDGMKKDACWTVLFPSLRKGYPEK